MAIRPLPAHAAVLLLLIACGGCSESASGDGVGGVSASEARALNDAAEMLDKRPAPPGVTAAGQKPAG